MIRLAAAYFVIGIICAVIVAIILAIDYSKQREVKK